MDSEKEAEEQNQFRDLSLYKRIREKSGSKTERTPEEEKRQLPNFKEFM